MFYVAWTCNCAYVHGSGNFLYSHLVHPLANSCETSKKSFIFLQSILCIEKKVFIRFYPEATALVSNELYLVLTVILEEAFYLAVPSGAIARKFQVNISKLKLTIHGTINS